MMMLDLSFKFGHFYNESSGGFHWYQIVPVITFMAGYLLNYFVEVRKENNRIKELKNYLKEVTPRIAKSIRNQAEAFVEFSNTLKSDRDADYGLGILPSSNTDAIKEIQFKDLFKIFITIENGESKDKSDNFFRFQSYVRYIPVTLTSAQKSFDDEFLKRRLEYHNNWNNAFVQIGNFVSENVNNLISEGKRPSDDYLVFTMRSILDEWWLKNQENGIGTDCYVAEIEVVIPLMALLEKQVGDSRIPFILPLARECRHAIRELKNLRAFYAKQFVRISEDLKTVADKMETISDGL